MCKSI